MFVCLLGPKKVIIATPSVLCCPGRVWHSISSPRVRILVIPLLPPKKVQGWNCRGPYDNFSDLRNKAHPQERFRIDPGPNAIPSMAPAAASFGEQAFFFFFDPLSNASQILSKTLSTSSNIQTGKCLFHYQLQHELKSTDCDFEKSNCNLSYLRSYQFCQNIGYPIWTAPFQQWLHRQITISHIL